MYVDVHGSKAQARFHRNWSTWFIFDGPDDAVPLCIADREGELAQMVHDLERDGVSIGDSGYAVLCFLTADGKGMIASTPRPGCKCQWCNLAAAQFGSAMAPSDFVPDDPTLSACLYCIPGVRRIGDLVHGALRTTNCLIKRLLADPRAGRSGSDQKGAE